MASTPDTSFGAVFVAAAFHLPPHPSSTRRAVICGRGHITASTRHAVICSCGPTVTRGNLATSSWKLVLDIIVRVVADLVRCHRDIVVIVLLAEVNKISTRKKKPPVSEVVVNTEKKLKFSKLTSPFQTPIKQFFTKKEEKLNALST